MMRDDTAARLKGLGWMAPENEGDNWKEPIGAGDRGAATASVAQALEAYGLRKGEAMSLTVGADLAQ